MVHLLSSNNITSKDLIKASLKKAKESSKYNAFITITADEAEKNSQKSFERYSAQKPLSEIDGVPIAIKDNFCTKNITTTCASNMLKSFVPLYNATVCERLLNSGAVLIGKTNLDQFAMGSGTVDSIFGPCKNPWGFDDNNFNITGGSSGGSAVAVATGVCFA